MEEVLESGPQPGVPGVSPTPPPQDRQTTPRPAVVRTRAGIWGLAQIKALPPNIQLVPPRSQLSSKGLRVFRSGLPQANMKEIVCLTIHTHPAISRHRWACTRDSDPFCAQGRNKAGLAGRRRETAKEEQDHCHETTRSCSDGLPLGTRRQPFIH